MKSVLTVFLFAASALAYDCDSKVVDNAHVLGGKTPQIVVALASITAKGGDPRVITDEASVLPEAYVQDVKNQCPSWQSSSGGVKNNLIIFLVFPQHHKMGLFVGQEFTRALNTSAIRSQFMAPGFKDGDYARGFLSGIKQAAVQIEHFQNPSKDSVDLSGLWTVMKWALLLAVLGAGVFLLIYFRNRRREQKDAQQRAVQARNDAAERVTKNPDSAEAFSRLNLSETFNPDTNGLSVDQYDAMAARYNGIGIAAAEPPRKRKTKYGPDSGRYSSAPTQPSVQSTTIINESSPSYVPIPVIIEEPVYVPDRSYREESQPAKEWSYSSSRDDNNDDNSGGGFGGGSDNIDTSDNSGGFDGGSSDF